MLWEGLWIPRPAQALTRRCPLKVDAYGERVVNFQGYAMWI